jgi:putative MATE family efflux protein
MLKRYFGDKAFYKRLLTLAIPIMLQNGITNFVNMLDNVMVGRIGTLEMTGVAVTNQLIFVFNLCIFGAISGAGIFGAQFFGKGDTKGVRHTFRFKILFCSALCLLGILIFLFGGNLLISLYLKGEGTAADIEASLGFAREYMLIMLIGLLPYTIAQCFSSTLRETGKAVPPMTAGIIAVFINLVLNYLLIFGKLGFPKLGVAGAAIATVISRFAELAMVVLWTIINRKKNEFIVGAFKSIYIPIRLIKDITIKGLPLMLNETLWAAGMAMLSQCYSLRGLSVVAANNICQTFFNVFAVSFMSVGVAIGIILGQMLGSGELLEAKKTAVRAIAFSVLLGFFIAAVYVVAAEFIPLIYNTNDEVRLLATRLMQVSAIAMPIDAFANAAYFTLRSGGKTAVTFIFDSGFMWVVAVPVAFILSRFTSLNIILLFAICQGINIIKDIIGYYFVKKGIWIENLTV